MSRHRPPSDDFPEPDPRYDPPSDPWGDAAPHHPDPHVSGYPHPAYPEPAELPAPRRRNWPLTLTLIMLVGLVAGGVATGLYLVSGDHTQVAGGGVEPTGEVGEAGSTVEPGSGTPDNVGLAASQAEVGDCLVNDGSEEFPQMRIIACDDEEQAESHFLVLARFDAQVSDSDEAHETCLPVAGYQYHYFFITAAEGQSFVLCMSDP